MAVGATVTATLVVDTDPSLTTLSNIAFAGSGGLDISTFDNEDGLEFPLQPVADLSVTKTGPATVSSAGGVAEYVIEYRNDGPSTADGRSRHRHPAHRADATARHRMHDRGTTVSCPVGSVAPGATGSITIAADVDPALPLGTELTDVATISSSAAGFDDPDPDDNTFELTSTVVVAQPAPTTTSPDVTPTTTEDDSDSGGGGSLPIAGAAIAGLLVAHLRGLVASGGGLRAIARGAGRDDDAPSWTPPRPSEHGLRPREGSEHGRHPVRADHGLLPAEGGDECAWACAVKPISWAVTETSKSSVQTRAFHAAR